MSICWRCCWFAMLTDGSSGLARGHCGINRFTASVYQWCFGRGAVASLDAGRGRWTAGRPMLTGSIPLEESAPQSKPERQQNSQSIPEELRKIDVRYRWNQEPGASPTRRPPRGRGCPMVGGGAGCRCVRVSSPTLDSQSHLP